MVFFYLKNINAIITVHGNHDSILTGFILYKSITILNNHNFFLNKSHIPQSFIANVCITNIRSKTHNLF